MTPSAPAGGDPPVSVQVVDAVAEAEGVDPTRLSPPLYEAVNTEALNALVANTEPTDHTTIRVSFSYHGYMVTVRGDGQISLKDLAG